MSTLKLFCLVDGDTPLNAFPVDIDSCKTVGDLKKLIKTENAPHFNAFPANQLTLWSVSLQVPTDKDKPILLSNVNHSESALDPTDDVCDVFTVQPSKKTISIIVKVPATVTVSVIQTLSMP